MVEKITYKDKDWRNNLMAKQLIEDISACKRLLSKKNPTGEQNEWLEKQIQGYTKSLSEMGVIIETEVQTDSQDK